MLGLSSILLTLDARAAPTTPALVDDLLATRWTVDEGLPLDHLNALALAPDGALWIATYDGLVRFDGQHFEVFRKSNAPRLPSNRFTHVASSRDGAIWARAESGELVRIIDDDLEAFTLEALASPVDALVSSRDGLFALSAAGPWVLSREAPRRAFAIVGPTEPGAAMTGLALSADGRFWVTTRRGLFVYPEGRLLIEAEDAEVLGLDDRGELWVGGSGLYRVSTADGRVTSYPGFDDVCAFAARPGAEVEIRDRRGWWRLRAAGPPVPLVSDEVPFCDANPNLSWPWRIAGRGILREDTLVFRSSQPATALLPAPDGSVWVATRSGLVRLHARPISSLPSPTTWASPSVDLVHRDRRGGLWVASLTDGLSRLSPPLAVELPLVGTEGRRPLMLGLVEYEDGRFEIGTDGGRCTLAPGMSRCAPSLDDPPGGGVLVPLLVDEVGGRTFYGGLGAWVRGAGELHQRDRAGRWRALRLAGQPVRHARAAVVSPDAVVYVATVDAGLVIVRGDMVEGLTSDDGLSSDRLRSLHLDPRGDLWIGTEDAGLCRYRPSEGIRCVDVADGLGEDIVHAIVPDPMNRLWLSGNRGLVWVRVEAVERVMDGLDASVLAVKLDTRDGMPHREGNGILPQPATSDGQRLYLATQGGVAVVDPRLAEMTTPPGVKLRSVEVAGRARDFEAGMSIGLGADDGLELAWSAPQFSYSDDLRFRYRFEGEDWSAPSSATHASWATLPRGRSVIEVQAGLGGAWGNELLAVSVERAPRFIETAWFPVAVGGGVFLALASLVVAWYTRQRKVRERLEAEVSRRTSDLSAVNASLAAKTAEVERQARRLAELNELRQRFVADLSHELRTPLTLVEGPIDDLVADLPAPVREAQRPRLELIKANVARLEVLSDQLLDVARLEGGKVPLRVRRHALGTFVAAIVARFSPAFSKKELTLRFEAEHEGPIVYFDGDLLDKVLTNLLANALKFTSKGGVVVSIRPVRGGDEGAVEVRVTDTGLGIALERNPSLFTRFYQVDRGDARRFEGVGIGLALVRDLVALHGGEVGVESSVGEGASFWFTLPLGAAHLAPDDIDLRPPGRFDAGLVETKLASFENLPGGTNIHGTGLPRVLLVEDHPDMRAYLAMHLREHFEVVEAEGGEAALQVLTLAGAAGALPAAIVSDVMMPGLDGLALAKKLATMAPMDAIPLLLVSAKAGDEDRVAGLEVADDYLTKPVRPRELVARLKRLIATGRRLERTIPPEPAAVASPLVAEATPERPRRKTSEVVLSSLFPEGLPERPSPSLEPHEPGPHPGPVAVANIMARAGHAPTVEVQLEDVDGGESELDAVSPTPATDPASLRQRARLDRLIDERLSDEGFGVIELAAALGLSRRQLQREVRRLTGEPPSDYLRRRRMERAFELLTSGARDTVAEVAAAVGLSPAYFSRLYAVWHGRSPSDDLARKR